MNNQAIVNCVNKAAENFHKRNAPLSATENEYADGLTLVTCTLTGFHANKRNQVIEVKVNDVVLDRVIIANLRMKFKHNFSHTYGSKTRIGGM